MIVGQTATATMRGKIIPGYVQKFEVYPSFVLGFNLNLFFLLFILILGNHFKRSLQFAPIRL